MRVGYISTMCRYEGVIAKQEFSGNGMLLEDYLVYLDMHRRTVHNNPTFKLIYLSHHSCQVSGELAHAALNDGCVYIDVTTMLHSMCILLASEIASHHR